MFCVIGSFEWLYSDVISLRLSYPSMLEEGIDDHFIVKLERGNVASKRVHL